MSRPKHIYPDPYYDEDRRIQHREDHFCQRCLTSHMPYESCKEQGWGKEDEKAWRKIVGAAKKELSGGR